MYNFKPKLSEDMVTSNTNMANAESKYGTWDLLQLNAPDPSCPSSGCEKSEYVKEEEAKIVSYPAPRPLDSDVLSTLNHEEEASTALGHTWKV